MAVAENAPVARLTSIERIHWSAPTAQSKVRDKQLIATKHVERQGTIAVVKSIETPAFLIAMRRIIGRVIVQDDFFRRRLEAVKKRIDKYFVKLQVQLLVDAVLQS